MRGVACLIFVLLTSAVFAERQSFDFYQSIVDRQMFGAPPLGFDPTKMPNEVAKTSSKAEKELEQEQEQIKKAIRFSVINVTPSGETIVGFTDSGDPKNPLHYYLKVGESQDGWTVKEADKDAATMTIENKEGISVALKLGCDSASDVTTVSRAGNNASNAPNITRGSSLLGSGSMRSLREQRRLREEQIRADEAAKHAEAEKARAAREEEANSRREAEREEQRKQLLQIQEELRKAREAREAQQSQPRPETSKEPDTAVES